MCYYMPVLDAAFSGRFTEGQNLIMTIDDFEFPEMFGLAKGWMYTQKLQNSTGGKPETHDLYKLWFLADRLLIPKLQNDAITEIINQTGKDTPYTASYWIYQNTMPDSKLRRVFIDKCASEVDENHLAKMSKEGKLSPEFVTDVFLALKNGTLDTRFFYLNRRPRKLKVEDYKVVETNL